MVINKMQINAADDIEKSKKLAIHYLNISLDDLKISDFLYRNGYYSAAIFHLEQATEKLIKSCGYKLKLIYPDKKISHATWKIYSDSLERCNLLDLQAKRKIILDSLVLEYLFKEFKLGRRNFKNLNKFLLNNDNINKIKKINFPSDIVSETLRRHYFLREDTLKLISDLEFSNEDSWGEKFFKGLGIVVITFGAISQLYYLFPLFSIDISIILFKHTEISRYGIESDRKLPTEIYTQDHVLIKEYNEIYKIINNMQKIINMLLI